jgi:hypothetical protein
MDERGYCKNEINSVHIPYMNPGVNLSSGFPTALEPRLI